MRKASSKALLVIPLVTVVFIGHAGINNITCVRIVILVSLQAHHIITYYGLGISIIYYYIVYLFN